MQREEYTQKDGMQVEKDTSLGQESDTYLSVGSVVRQTGVQNRNLI